MVLGSGVDSQLLLLTTEGGMENKTGVGRWDEPRGGIKMVAGRTGPKVWQCLEINTSFVCYTTRLLHILPFVVGTTGKETDGLVEKMRGCDYYYFFRTKLKSLHTATVLRVVVRLCHCESRGRRLPFVQKDKLLVLIMEGIRLRPARLTR